MSQSSPSIPESLAPDSAPVSALSRVGTAVKEPLEAAAFWTAVVLPVGYFPLLATGLEGRTLVAFVGLLLLNALALLVGHSHHKEE